ncbi:MAG: hypothetical protein RL204_993 [Bacteroidota bacterium]|jgi:hypothetical protein
MDLSKYSHLNSKDQINVLINDLGSNKVTARTRKLSA